MNTTIVELIKSFEEDFSGKTTAEKPLWIHCDLLDKSVDLSYVFEYDFKNDEARRRFGMLCAAIYKSSERWTIQTWRD